MKRYKVKHYFVLARLIKKDGSVSKSFSTFDYLDKQKAENDLHKFNSLGEDKWGRKTLPFQLIEYEALQVPEKSKNWDGTWEEEFLTIYVAPKSVRDIYNKNAGLI